MFFWALIPFLLAVLQGIIPGIIHQQSGYTWFGLANYPETLSAFGHWIGPVLLLLGLVYAVGQLLPGFRQDPLVKRLRFSVCGLFLSGTIFSCLPLLMGNGWWLIASICTMWAFAISGLLTIIESEVKNRFFHQWFTRPLFGLYAGWLSVLMWLVASNFCHTVLNTHFGWGNTVFALLTLTTIVAFSTTVLLQTNGCRWYGGAVLWALYAVLWHNVFDQFNLVVGVFVSVSVVLVYTLLAITPLSRLFRYVRRTHMREWLKQSLGITAISQGFSQKQTRFSRVKQPSK